MKAVARSCFQLISFLAVSSSAWIPTISNRPSRPSIGRILKTSLCSTKTDTNGNLHGQNACFLPLKQLDQDYYAPRIVQIAGSYPGLTREEFFAVSSEPSPALGQWTYDFSDPDGPQLGTVALEGSNIVGACEDPVVIIAEHTSLALPLPDVIEGAVDLVVLADRAKKKFGERTFLVLDTPGKGVTIGAFNSQADLPEGSEILGQVELVQVPWLPSMAPTKTGFMESDEYF